MPATLSDGLILSVEESLELDFDLVESRQWISEVIDSQLNDDNARYEELFAAEAQYAAGLDELARQQGHDLQSPAVTHLIELQDRSFDLVRHRAHEEEVVRLELDDRFGIRRDFLPARRPGIYTRSAPFSIESETQRDGGTGMSFADKTSGRISISFRTGGLTSFEFASCTLGHTFRMPADNYRMDPTFRFRLINDVVEAWGLFSDADVELDVIVNTFKHGLNHQSWKKQQRIGRVVNAWFGVVGQRLGLGSTFSPEGFGQANKGDVVTVTATFVGRAKSPTGRAGMDFEAELLSLRI